MRRLPTRALAAVALAALTAGGLSACSVLDRKTLQDDARLSGKVTAVRIDNASGDVHVEASADTTSPSVHREVTYHGHKPGGTSFTVENGVLTLAGCGDDCEVDYVVKVPAGPAVTGGTSNGDITLTDVGRVDVHTGNGDITVDGATGPEKYRTSNGDVDVRRVRGGAVDAQTSNGDLTIRTAAPQNVTARTSSGDLTVAVPPAAYRISADDSNGDKKVAFGNHPSGRYRLDLSTTNGDLTVESAGR